MDLRKATGKRIEGRKIGGCRILKEKDGRNAKTIFGKKKG